MQSTRYESYKHESCSKTWSKLTWKSCFSKWIYISHLLLITLSVRFRVVLLTQIYNVWTSTKCTTTNIIECCQNDVRQFQNWTHFLHHSLNILQWKCCKMYKKQCNISSTVLPQAHFSNETKLSFLKRLSESFSNESSARGCGSLQGTY